MRRWKQNGGWDSRWVVRLKVYDRMIYTCAYYLGWTMDVVEASFYVKVCSRSGDDGVVRVTAITPEGSRIELLDRLARRQRSDVAAFYGLPIVFFSSRRRHTRFDCDWSSDVCSSD